MRRENRPIEVHVAGEGEIRGEADQVRRIAIDILVEVEKGSFLGAALERKRQKLSGPEVAYRRLHFLTAGVVKWQGRLDYELDRRLPKGIDSLPRSCRALLRIALFELRMSYVPDYAVVDSAVVMTRSIGLGGLVALVNGLLREAIRAGEPRPPEDKLERISVVTSHPKWLIETVAGRYGFENASSLAEWNNAPPPIWVRCNRLRVTTAEAGELLAAQGVSSEEVGLVPGFLSLEPGAVPANISGIKDGWLTVQDPSAGLAGLMAFPVRGKRVADICAAPGGKSTHLAELGEGEATIDATDSDPARLGLLHDTVSRHGGTGLRVCSFEEVVGRMHSYDVVLVDAPCSNLGVLRRRADARWRIGPQDPAALASVQLELMEKGAELVRPGGVLVYSTCTITAEENEMVVERFLSQHYEFDRDRVPMTVPEEFITGVGAVASLPWCHSIDGAFVVRLIRRDSEE